MLELRRTVRELDVLKCYVHWLCNEIAVAIVEPAEKLPSGVRWMPNWYLAIPSCKKHLDDYEGQNKVLNDTYNRSICEASRARLITELRKLEATVSEETAKAGIGLRSGRKEYR